jgi:uncharacterized damage-inducible protein DinB
MMKDYFVQLTTYNEWANAKAINWVLEIDDRQWLQVVTSSFSSVSQTALHIASAEKVWTQFWEGVPHPTFLSKEFKGSKEDLIRTWKRASADLKRLVEHWPEDEWLRTIEYQTPRGKQMATPFRETVAHVINHSTYHRGQLVNVLRQVGFTNFSSTDLATFFTI